MGYQYLADCVDDLKRQGHLIVVDHPVDPNLEMAEIHRRVYASGGPALLFTSPTGCRFPMASNLFGTLDRARYIFRDTFVNVQRAIGLKVHPEQALKNPLKYWKAPLIAWQMQPKTIRRGRAGSVTENEIPLNQLPRLKCWPDDGGAFVTLPQVYSEDVTQPGLMKSNMGMYRVQISGNQFNPTNEVGIHYQIHRGIGVHHKSANAANQPFRVNVFIGGNPAMTVAAVMPLPEGMSELTFAGALAGHRIPMIRQPNSAAIYANADFCISGTIDPTRTLPEGPFGDHLGYYSLTHPFPVLNVDKVYHRTGAIWPFTVVGRPPQEDTVFGELIHELTGPVIPTVLPGVKEVNAVDASGVHPLLLAIGSERYLPYEKTTAPQELLTQANAILGQGQMSLAKYLWIVDEASRPGLKASNIESFFDTVLRRVDWTRDLHFQTKTTIDTLDYSGSGFNSGSKVVIAAAGEPIRELPTELCELNLPDGFSDPKICVPGVVAITAPRFTAGGRTCDQLRRFCQHYDSVAPINRYPLIVLVDDSSFAAATLNNFLWTVFTRSNPASDIDGIGASIIDKHWGCHGSLVIDARVKPFHAPPLLEDAEITKRVDALAASGGPLAKYL
jgi:4-hydroxy-3-polyprenylbenzoate decarboxylase